MFCCVPSKVNAKHRRERDNTQISASFPMENLHLFASSAAFANLPDIASKKKLNKPLAAKSVKARQNSSQSKQKKLHNQTPITPAYFANAQNAAVLRAGGRMPNALGTHNWIRLLKFASNQNMYTVFGDPLKLQLSLTMSPSEHDFSATTCGILRVWWNSRGTCLVDVFHILSPEENVVSIRS